MGGIWAGDRRGDRVAHILPEGVQVLTDPLQPYPYPDPYPNPKALTL